jgi:hypothetical protein
MLIGDEEKKDGLEEEIPGDNKDEQGDPDEKKDEQKDPDEDAKDDKDPDELTDEEKAAAEKLLEEEEIAKGKTEVQRRIDELTAMNIEAQKIIKEQAEALNSGKGSGKKETTWDDYSDAELKKLAADQPEYADTVESILANRMESRVEKRLESKMTAKELTDQSYAKIEEKLPAYAKKDTPEWVLANQVYIQLGLDKSPDGPYLAALYARDMLEKGKPDRSRVLKSQLDKERAKKALASGKGGKGGLSSSSSLEKAFQQAQGTEAGSVEWKRYLKLSRESRKNKE